MLRVRALERQSWSARSSRSVTPARRWSTSVALVSLLVIASAACDRKDDDGAPSIAPSSVVSASEAPPERERAPTAPSSPSPPAHAPSAPSSAAAPSAGVAPGTASTPAVAAVAPAGAHGHGADAGAASGECGKKGSADCPLQGWMKRETIPVMASNDLPAIAGAFDQMVDLLPPPPAPVGDAAAPPYTNWVSIARDGAAAARAGNIDAVKGACRGCHEQYIARYRAEQRARPLPSLPPQASPPLP